MNGFNLLGNNTMKDKTTCNRNARRTRALIEGAFLELMKEKPYTKISVREITEKADINRSTFYLHYQDIYDLLNKIETRITEDIKETIFQIRREDYVPGRHPFHVLVFRELMQHEEIFRILLSKNGDIDFIYKLATTMGEGLYQGWSSYYSGHIPPELEMYVSFLKVDTSSACACLRRFATNFGSSVSTLPSNVFFRSSSPL